MQYNGKTWVGALMDGGGTIHGVFYDTCPSVRIDSTDHGRKTWRIKHVREGAFRPASRLGRHPPGRSLARTLSERLQALFGGPPCPHRKQENR